MTKKKIVAIIPARGGSKGIPDKNIKLFAGKPLIAHTIEYAKTDFRINGIYVSTDSEKIEKAAIEYGASIIKRPPELSTDTATTESAVEHALQYLKKHNNYPDIIILFQATSPLRPTWGLTKALDRFLGGNYDSLLTISPTHRFFWQKNGDIAKPLYDYKHRPRRQDMKEEDIHYIENGSFYIFTTKHFEKEKNRLGGKIGYIEFPEEYSGEIDSIADFISLEQLYLEINGDIDKNGN